MPLTKYNGTALEQIIYNGVDLDEVYYNGVLVFSKPVVFNGSKFGGQLKNGVLAGPSLRAYGSYIGTAGFDQAASGTVYTAGAISNSHYFTSIYADGSSTIHGGFITRNAIDVTNISTIKIDQTFEWWVRDITTNSPDWVTITLEGIYLCTQDGTRYIVNNHISGSPYGVVPGYNGTNGNNTTIGGYSFNLSSYTGSYYLYFNFLYWCEVRDHSAKSTINKITITYTG